MFLFVLLIPYVSAADNETPIEYHELEARQVDYVFYGGHDKYFVGDLSGVNLTEESELGQYSNGHDMSYGDYHYSRYILLSNKTNPNLTVSIANRTIDGNATLIIKTNQNATGDVLFSFTNESYKLKNGFVKVDLNNLDYGNYIFDLYYTGDNTFTSLISSYMFEIISQITYIQGSDVEMYYRNGSRFSVALCDYYKRPLANKTVYLELNHKGYYKKTNENGIAYLNLNLNPGQYCILAYFKGTHAIQGNNTTSKIKILPTLFANNLTKTYKNASQYHIKALDNRGNPISNLSITLNINGVYYYRNTDANGIAKLNINLCDGNYILTATNPLNNYSISNRILVLPTLISDDLVKVYGNTTQYIVKAIYKNNTPLSNIQLEMNINGVYYLKKTNSQGISKLNINLSPGRYIITVLNPNDMSKISNTIVVTPYLYTHDLVKYYKNASRFGVSLTDENYNPISSQAITFAVNGIEYTKTTDRNGKCSLAINLQPGDYEIKTQSKEYEVINHIKVLPTLLDYNSEGITIDYEWNESYKVKILDGNGNPLSNQDVKFDYAGRSCTVKSDSNGIVSFQGLRINQNNPLTISYNGYSITNDNVTFKPSFPITFQGPADLNPYYSPDGHYDASTIKSYSRPFPIIFSDITI